MAAARLPGGKSTGSKPGQARGSDSAAAAPAKAAGNGEQPPKRKRRFPYRKVADLEAEIAQREARIQESPRSWPCPTPIATATWCGT